MVVPLFSSTESPSELSAEVTIDPSGVATIHDVRGL